MVSNLRCPHDLHLRRVPLGTQPYLNCHRYRPENLRKLSNEITLAKNTLTKALEDLEAYEKIELKNDKSQMFAATNKASGRGGKKGVYGDKKNQPIKVSVVFIF